MPYEVNYSLEEESKKTLEIPCANCSIKTHHSISVSYLESGSEYASDRSWGMDWQVQYQILMCNGCKTFSFRKVSSDSESCYQISETEWETAEIETLYPSRVEGHKGLKNDIYSLPGKLRPIYTETIEALNNNFLILAGVGLRAILETICKDKKATGKDFYHKIDDLVTKTILTPDGSKILHKIRALGNESAHAVKAQKIEQLRLAIEVIENCLQSIYILPSKSKQVFKETKKDAN